MYRETATALLIMGVILGMLVERIRVELRRKNWRKRNGWDWKRAYVEKTWEPKPQPSLRATASKNLDAADQLRIVMEADFAAQPLVNKSEARVLRQLAQFVEMCNPEWRVMAQVSLGEIIISADALAFSCVNAKRVDLLLVDGEFRPRHAIEYQGLGHYQSSAAARDAIKKEALRRAGIGYHEVVAGRTTPSDLQRLVETLVVRQARP